MTFQNEAIKGDVASLRHRALVCSREQDWRIGYQTWHRLLEQVPNDPEALYRLCEASFWLGEISECIDHGERYHALRPDDQRVLEFLGRCYTKLKDIRAARKIWEAMLDRNPAYYEGWIRLAQCHVDADEIDAATASLDRAFALDPLNGAAYPLAGRIFRRLSSRSSTHANTAHEALARWLGAIEARRAGGGHELLNHIPQRQASRREDWAILAEDENEIPARLSPRPPKLRMDEARSAAELVAHARALHAEQDWAGASAAWREVLESSPRNFEAHLRLGQTLIAEKRLEDALPHLRNAHNIRPQHAQALAEYTDCLAALNRKAEAISAWQAVVDSNPTDFALQARQATFLAKAGEPQLALDVALKAFAGLSEPDRTAVLLARLLAGAGEWRSLVSNLGRLCRREAAHMVEPDRVELVVRYAIALANTGAASEAIEWFQFADDNGPCTRLVTRNYIRILARLNHVELAQSVVERMLARVGHEHWAWLDAIEAHVSLGNPEEAYRCFVTAGERLDLSFAEWLEFAEKIELLEARKLILDRICQHDSDDPMLLIRMARVAFRQGDTRLALRLVHRATERAPGDTSIKSDMIEIAYYHSELQRQGLDLDNVVFPDSAFELVCKYIMEHPRRIDPEPGVIVLSNSSLAAGGAERQIAMTLSGLSKVENPKFSLHLVCRDLSGTTGRDRYLEFIRERGVNVVDLSEREETPIEALDSLEDTERRLLKLFDPNIRSEMIGLYTEFVRLRPAVVHLWQDRTNLLGAIAAALAGVPRIVLCGRSTRPVTWQRYRPYMPRAYHAVMTLPGVVLTNNSRAGGDDYADWLGIPPSSVDVVYNGFEFDRLVTAENIQNAGRRRKELGIPSGHFVVGGVFRITPVKQPMLWAEVARRVCDQLDNVHFVIAGKGPLREDMARYVQHLGMAERFHFLGHVDVGPWYPTMDALLLTSETEGLPNVVIEAQAFGVPAVSTNVGGVREIIVEGRTGYTVDGNDPDQLAHHLCRIFSDAQWRATAKNEASARAQSLFGADSMIARTLEVYGFARGEGDERHASFRAPADATGSPKRAENTKKSTASKRKTTSATPIGVEGNEAGVRAQFVVPDMPPIPSEIRDLMELGRAHFGTESLEDARQLFAQAHRAAPRHTEPLRWLARTWRGLGEHAEALRAWRQVIWLSPADREAHIRVMESLVRLGLSQQAIAFASRALLLVPDEPSILRHLARIHMTEGNFADALSVWDALLVNTPGDFEALFRSGEIALQLENEGLAEQRLREAAAHERHDPRPAITLARHWSWIGRIREARRLLRAALLKQPRHPDIWRAVFDLMRAAGRIGLADRVLSRMRRKLSIDAQAKLFYAELLVCAQALNEAEKELCALRSDSQVGASAAQRLGMLRLRRGYIAEAAQLAATNQKSATRCTDKGALESAIADCQVFLRVNGGQIGKPWPSTFIEGIDRLLSARHGGRPEPRPGVIMHVLNSLAAGGTERQCATISCRQAERRSAHCEIWVVRTDPRRAGRGAFFLPQLEASKVRTATLSTFSARAAVMQNEIPALAEPPESLRPIVNTREIAGIVAAIEAIRPSVVQAWTPQCSAHAALAGLIAGVPNIVLRGGSVAPDARPFITDAEADRQAWMRSAIQFALNFPSVALVNNCRANLLDWLCWLDRDIGDFSDRVGVVPNLLDPDSLPKPDSRASMEIARKLGLGPKKGRKVVGSVMRLEREKDPDLWVDIVSEVCRRRQDVVFVLIGDGRLRRHVERRLAQRDLEDNVVLTGTVSERLAEHYALFDVFLLTSLFEGLPNVLLEAQHYGVPVVAPAVGGVEEAMLPKRSGLAVADRQPTSYADALSHILDNPSLRKKMSLAGRDFVKRFSADAVLDGFEVFYGASDIAAPGRRRAL